MAATKKQETQSTGFDKKGNVAYKSWLLSVNLQFEFFLEKLS